MTESTATTTDMLGVEEAVAYWDERHRAKGALASGGDVSNDQASNELFYATRLAHLIDIVGDGGDIRAPRRMLDAGCGKGYFTRAMAKFGHQMDGVDSSPKAIEVCRKEAVARESYAVSTLNEWRPPYLYDVVFSVDVLFHITDDTVWGESVTNLASLVRWGGQLVLADHYRDQDRIWSNYLKSRAASRYHDLMTARGFRVDPFVPYRFRHTPVGFHVFTRVA